MDTTRNGALKQNQINRKCETEDVKRKREVAPRNSPKRRGTAATQACPCLRRGLKIIAVITPCTGERGGELHPLAQRRVYLTSALNQHLSPSMNRDRRHCIVEFQTALQTPQIGGFSVYQDERGILGSYLDVRNGPETLHLALAQLEHVLPAHRRGDTGRGQTVSLFVLARDGFIRLCISGNLHS